MPVKKFNVLRVRMSPERLRVNAEAAEAKLHELSDDWRRVFQARVRNELPTSAFRHVIVVAIAGARTPGAAVVRISEAIAGEQRLERPGFRVTPEQQHLLAALYADLSQYQRKLDLEESGT